MIINLILVVVKGIVNIILLPVSALNVVVDFASHLVIIQQFLKIVAYILPWSNILPLIILTIAIFVFRIAISLVKTIWSLIPFM